LNQAGRLATKNAETGNLLFPKKESMGTTIPVRNWNKFSWLKTLSLPFSSSSIVRVTPRDLISSRKC
jgi:hypothetical protein